MHHNALYWDLFCFAVLLVKKAHNVTGGLLVALLPEELGCLETEPCFLGRRSASRWIIVIKVNWNRQTAALWRYDSFIQNGNSMLLVDHI